MLWRHELVYKEHPEILTPTHIYAPMVQKLMTSMGEHAVFGMAHITGGGLEENINRIMPAGLHAYIDWSSWRRPEIFNVITWASRQNDLTEDVSEEELRRVFNCGIGFALVTPFPDAVMELVDEETMIIGKVVDNS